MSLDVLELSKYPREALEPDPWTPHGQRIKKHQARKVCKLPDCTNEHYCRGWCITHYNRWYNTGSPLGSKLEVAQALKTLPTAPWRYYERWTMKQIQKAHKLRDEGKTISEIAKALGRTRQSVKAKIQRTRNDPRIARRPRSDSDLPSGAAGLSPAHCDAGQRRLVEKGSA